MKSCNKRDFSCHRHKDVPDLGLADARQVTARFSVKGCPSHDTDTSYLLKVRYSTAKALISTHFTE